MRLSKKTKIGIFSFSALIVLALGILLTKNINFSKGYNLNLRYNFISGIKVGSPVVFSGGLRMGHVLEITKISNQLNVKIWVENQYKIDRKTRFVIFASGMLGDKYIEVENPEPSGEYFKPNDIVQGVNPISLDALSLKFGNMANSLFSGATTSEDIQKSFVYLFKNTSEMMYQLNKLVKENQPGVKSSVDSLSVSLKIFQSQLNNILASLQRASKNIDSFSVANKKSLETSIASLQISSQNIEAASKDLVEVLKNSKNITRAIREQKGTVGKLIYDDKIYKNLEKTSKNLQIFSGKIKKNPKSVIW